MLNRARLASLALLAVCVSSPALAQDEGPGPAEESGPTAAEKYPELEPGIYALLETNHGDILLSLEHERAPLTVANFLGLIEGSLPRDPSTGESPGTPFYDGLTFHRVLKGFMIQGGDPQGTGRGGPGYRFRDEFHPELRHDRPGVLSMANSGQGTNGSQFFITLAASSHLDGPCIGRNGALAGHTIFGHVIEGMEVVEAIGGVRVSRTPAEGTPVEPVTIIRASALRVGEAAQAWDPMRKSIPAAEGAVDPARAFDPQAELQDRARVRVILIQHVDAERKGYHVVLSRAEAASAAQRLLRLAREEGADFAELARRYGDHSAEVVVLERDRNDPSLEPAFRLAPGQVSDVVETPYGFMILQAQ
jgi:cyclophilin family peptidyl-prolyl cis-trans isomerase